MNAHDRVGPPAIHGYSSFRRARQERPQAHTFSACAGTSWASRSPWKPVSSSPPDFVEVTSLTGPLHRPYSRFGPMFIDDKTRAWLREADEVFVRPRGEFVVDLKEHAMMPN